MASVTGAEALVDALARENTEVVFGIPGVQIMDILDAVYQHKGIRWITVRHEQGAGYMALGYARTTGKEGVAVVVPGPGVLNAAAALGTAYAASVPVLMIAGQIDSSGIGKNKGSLHEMDDQLDVLKPITKWRHRVSDPGEISDSVHRAFRELKTGRQRPVEIEIPLDFLSSSTETHRIERTEPDIPVPDKDKVSEVAELVSKSEYPLIVAGGGVISSEASAELKHLAELVNAPVITTDEGKGSLSESHYLCLGSANGAVNTAISMADVFIVIGSRISARRNQQFIQSGKKLIQIDIDPDEIGRNFPVNIGIQADARSAIGSIVEEIPAKSKSLWDKDYLQQLKRDALKVLKESAPTQFSILQTIRNEIGNGILVPGVTNLGYWCQMAYPVYEPRTYLSSSYFGTLGYAFPTALGAKVGNPDKPVVALCGDGGFLYAASELATAVQEKINTVTLVLNNNSYGSCERIQQNRFQNRVIGTQLRNPDFARLAESFGAKGIKLQHVDELRDALKSAIAEDLPVVIELPVPDMEAPWEINR